MKYISFSLMRFLFSLGILMALLSGMTTAHAAWQEEWERVVTAAKKEGTVAVMGPTGTHRRDVLTQPFQKKYGIQVLYRGERGSGATPLVGLRYVRVPAFLPMPRAVYVPRNANRAGNPPTAPRLSKLLRRLGWLPT